MYGAFCYHEDGDGYISPFLMGVYNSVEVFNSDLPKLKEKYNFSSEDKFFITYSNDNTKIRVGNGATLFSLEELSINEIHQYWHFNDKNI